MRNKTKQTSSLLSFAAVRRFVAGADPGDPVVGRGARRRRLALTLAAAVATVLAVPSAAHAGLVQWHSGFEGPAEQRDWFFGNVGGFDNNRGWAHGGQDNGWVYAPRSSTVVWNSINAASISTAACPTCIASAWIAASSSIQPGFAKLDVWDQNCIGGSCRPLAEVVLGAGNNGGWTQVTTAWFGAPPGQQLFFDVGVFNSSSGADQWLRIDDVVISCVD